MVELQSNGSQIEIESDLKGGRESSSATNSLTAVKRLQVIFYFNPK